MILLKKSKGLNWFKSYGFNKLFMLLMIIIILSVAIFCFTHELILIGIICLLGFSKKFGWPALIITSIFLFIKGYWYIALAPLILILWNIIGLKLINKD